MVGVIVVVAVAVVVVDVDVAAAVVDVASMKEKLSLSIIVTKKHVITSLVKEDLKKKVNFNCVKTH